MSSGAPADLTEFWTFVRTRAKRAQDALAYFDQTGAAQVMIV